MIRKIKKRNKKGYYFSLDAFIALVIVLGVILFIKPGIKQVTIEEHAHEDLMFVLSELKISEINNSYAEYLRTNGFVEEGDENISVLEYASKLYATGDITNSSNLIESILVDDLNITNKNIIIYFGGIPFAGVSNIPIEDAEDVQATRQIISGIQHVGAGNSTKGFSARAFLTSSNRVDYFYFGGYIGDGNISVKVEDDLVGASIEGAFGGNFTLYINNQSAGTYAPTPNVPYSINLASHLDKFNETDNYVEFRSPSNVYIAGGYLKTVHNNSNFSSVNPRRYIPGIEGFINIYDSFYVPSNIDSMEVFLHYNSSYNIFMTIGNKTIYEGNISDGHNGVINWLNDGYLSAIFAGNYNELQNQTVPFRIGLSNVSYVQNITLNSDVYSVTDLSGSMCDCSDPSQSWICGWDPNNMACCRYNQLACETSTSCDPGSYCTAGIYEAKDANDLFIDSVLNISGNRVGLVGYSSTAPSGYSHSLSNNSTSLKAEVESWYAVGSTCICCGINSAASSLNSQANPGSIRSLVIMSDGVANVECSQQGSTPDLNGNGQVDDAGDDAIKAACDAYNNYNITVYSVGFGSSADSETLEEIGTSCGGRGYFDAQTLEQLTEIYQEIAQNIIEASYVEQTITGAPGVHTAIYPDSYIHVQYTQNIPYGLVISTETPVFGNNISQGSFDIPQNSTPIKARIISYSGSKWTNLAQLNNSITSGWSTIFNLSDYGLNFTSLGDPYFVNIPKEKIAIGNNTVKVGTGLSPGDVSGGSEYNKVIYSLAKDVSSYSPILPQAEGCTWNIEFEDSTTTLVSVPANYTGSNLCWYNSTGVYYPINDAISDAISRLLEDLDLNSNNKIDAKFSDNDLSMSAIEIAGIPFPWETEVQIITWR